jgi:hypothetical protein
LKLFWQQAAQLQFSADNFSCGTRQEQLYRQASATTELNVAPRMLQLQSSSRAKLRQRFRKI